MIGETLVLFKNIRQSSYSGSLAEYQKNGGYSAWKKVLKEIKADQLIQIVKDSGLRGRGGAGFPTGLKWGFMNKNTTDPSYLVCNADEGEPGTFKDREIMLKDPHLFLEGMMIGCYAVGCNCGYIYVRGEYYEAINTLKKEINILLKQGLLGENILGSGFNLKLVVHPGAGAYICGEETALLDSLEGKRGLPRVKPPFPAIAGFNACPTSVNNVETLANLPFIINNGAEEYKKIGTPNNSGTRIIGLSGNIRNPGAYEIAIGDNLKDIIYDLGGGPTAGTKIKAVIPGGSSAPILTAEEIDISYDFDSLQKVGSMSGSGAIIVIDDSVDLPKLLLRLVSFYSHESCGQCTPCREGLNWISKILRNLIEGRGTNKDIDKIHYIANNIAGNTLCALGDAGALPVKSFIDKFKPEFEAYCQKTLTTNKLT